MKPTIIVILIVNLFLVSNKSIAAFSFSDDFESGNLSLWGAIVPITEVSLLGCSSSLNVNGSAANLSSFGLEVTICDNSNLAYVQNDSPVNETSFRVMFDFNPNSVNIVIGSEIVIFQARSPNPAFDIRLHNNAGIFEIRAHGFNDAGMSVGFIAIPLPDLNTHRIGAGFTAATADGNDNGSLVLELDQVQSASTLSDLDNDTLQINSARLGILNSTSNIGSVYIDNYKSDNNNLPVTLMQFEVE